MSSLPKGVQIGEVFSTRDGNLIVEKYISAKEVYVRFLATNFVKITTTANILKGSVKDPYKPSVYGVGFLGYGRYPANSRRVKSSAYNCWHNMIKRCYCLSYQNRNPWYLDCTVADEWHNFQNFADWYYKNYIDGYELDKDIKFFGNKIYSPEFCQFVSPEINRSHKTSYTLRTRGKRKYIGFQKL